MAALLCVSSNCADPECRREHPCEFCKTFDHDPCDLDQCKAFCGTCPSCTGHVLETEAVEVRGSIYHEECAERLWPYDPARDPGIPKY